MKIHVFHGMGLRRVKRILLAAVTGLVLTGCDLELLDVPMDVVTPEATAGQTGAEALRLAAINRLGQTMTGTYTGATGLIEVSGLLADEFIVTSPRPGLEAIDSRVVDENNEQTYATAQFQRLSQTRTFTQQAIEGLQRYAPDRRANIAQMFAARAFAEILLAEHFCSGITLSEIVEGRAVYGEPLTTEEVFRVGLAHADSAVALTSGNDPISSLARVTRARALLNLGQFAEAASAVSAVPVDFVYHLEYSASATALYNGVYVWVNMARIFSIADNKGNNGLDFISAADPRLQVTLAGIGQDGRHNVWVANKYASPGAPVVLASGIEARLIQAEALLRGGDAPGALTILNNLRSRVSGLDPLTDAGSSTAREEQLFRERAFWLFGTASRLGDLRRLVRQYNRDQATVFPVGEYFKGGVFGSEVTLPMPLTEGNNPHYKGCISRGA
jgi:starch-binding outer membrane protein, SusD/RagB family